MHTPQRSLMEWAESATSSAMEAWRNQHCPGTPTDELLAGPVTSLEVQTTVLPGGRAMVAVLVRGRRKYDDACYLSRYQRKAHRHWIETGTAYPSR